MPIPSTQDDVADVRSATSARDVLPLAAVTALWNGHVIEATKLVRVERNISVKEAKAQVDAYLLHDPALKRTVEQIQADTRDGVLRWLTFLLIGGIGLTYLLL